jgi:hypothetical protein
MAKMAPFQSTILWLLLLVLREGEVAWLREEVR